MPVSFLAPEQVKQYGQYTASPTPEQLAQYFYLDDTDRAVISQYLTDHTRLGYAVQLGTVRFLGTFLQDWTETSDIVVQYLAQQLHIKDSDIWAQYIGSKTHRRHTEDIRQRYGYQEFHQSPRVFTLLRQLYTRAWLSEERPITLFDDATHWLLENKVLLPGATVLERLIARIVQRANEKVWQGLAQLPSEQQKENLLNLLEIPEGEHLSPLELLRRSPTRATSQTMRKALLRLETIRQLDVSKIDLSAVPPSRIRILARYGMLSWAQTIQGLRLSRRIATLLAFAHELETIAQDEALDIFVQIIHDKFQDAEKVGQGERLRSLKDLDAAAYHLRRACLVVLDNEVSGDRIRQQIFAQVPRDTLEEATRFVGQQSDPGTPHRYLPLNQQYRSIRWFLPLLLKTIHFEAVQADNLTLQAWSFLCQLDHAKPTPNLQEAPTDFIREMAWQQVVFDGQKQINRRYYSFCALQGVTEQLERHDIFISPSYRWNDQRSLLLQGTAWEKVRSKVCTALGKTTDADREMEKLASQLDEAYQRVAKNLAKNPSVSVKHDGKYDRIHVDRLDKLVEPVSLKRLRQEVKNLLPRIELPHLLLEIHALTGFADEFTHISERQSRIADLSLSICALLLAEACNIGIDQVASPDIPALERGRLFWVQQNFIRAETITRANACLVAAQTDILLAQTWGGGEVASADGLRFIVPVRNLYTAPNSKYFGTRRGVTYFSFTSDQYTSFYGTVIPGAVNEALYILDGLLEQRTVLEPQEVMADTASYTDIVFGLFWLLGYQFSPRLADISSKRFWRIDRQAHYGKLNQVARHSIQTQRITRNWDDLLRVSGSIKLGHVGASEFMRTLQASKSSTLAKAIQEVGRINKSLHLLNFVDDEVYRRRILTQLNRGESRHGLSRAVCFGKLGEMHKRYREGLEDQLGALGLVVNMIVLWNTLYMDKALTYLAEQGKPGNSDDVARLSPLGHEHINFLGRYDFFLDEQVRNGQLRPLRIHDL